MVICFRSDLPDLLQLDLQPGEQGASIPSGCDQSEAGRSGQGHDWFNSGIVGIPIAAQARLRGLAVERAAGPLKPAPDSISVVGALQLVDQEGQPVQPGGHGIGALPLAPGVATYRNCTNRQQAGEKSVVIEHLANGLPFGARRWAVFEPLASRLRADSLAQQGINPRRGVCCALGGSLQSRGQNPNSINLWCICRVGWLPNDATRDGFINAAQRWAPTVKHLFIQETFGLTPIEAMGF